MRGHNIYFHQETRKNICELSSEPLLIWSSADIAYYQIKMFLFVQEISVLRKFMIYKIITVIVQLGLTVQEFV